MTNEKRKHKRMPVIKQFGEAVDVVIDNQEKTSGIILDLSAGGISLMLFKSLPLGAEIEVRLKLPSLSTGIMKGKVMWAVPAGDMFKLGIFWTKISKMDIVRINQMALDFTDCENKITLSVPDICFNNCAYYRICDKPQKSSN